VESGPKSLGNRPPLPTRERQSKTIVKDHWPGFIPVERSRDRCHHSGAARRPRRIIHSDTMMTISCPTAKSCHPKY
jgi:hypothetical protein